MSLNKEVVRSLSNEDLMQIFKLYGVSVGPINNSTRSVYDKKIIKMFENKDVSQILLKYTKVKTNEKTNSVDESLEKNSKKKNEMKSYVSQEKLLQNNENLNHISKSSSQINKENEKIEKLEEELQNMKLKVKIMQLLF